MYQIRRISLSLAAYPPRCQIIHAWCIGGKKSKKKKGLVESVTSVLLGEDTHSRL